MAELILNNINKSFGKQQIIKDLSLRVADGEFVVLLGPSGCGKSTILRMVAGLDAATSGDIMMGARRVNDVEAKDRNLAMVFQSYALYPHMTVYQNIAFALQIGGVDKATIKAKVEQVANMLQLGELLQRKPAQLSGGQRQRVAMGRAMVRQPELFLFDEPLSNLDSKLRTKMRDEIKQIHSKLRTTTIYVTHDQIEAMTLADKIVILRAGSIEQVGAPVEVFLKPRNTFVAGFIGSPSMNMLELKLDGEADRAVLTTEAIKLKVPERYLGYLGTRREVILGIRPSDVRLAGAGESGADRINASVESLEIHGAEVLVHARAGGYVLAMQVPLAAAPKVGQSITMALDLAAAHLFDKATGINLLPA